MSIRCLQDEIVRKFAELDDWMDKYAYLIDLGKSLPPFDPVLKTEATAISGCQSKVWITAELIDGKMHFQADSDALITKGLIGLLLHVLNHQPPEAVMDTELSCIDDIGLRSSLSPSRADGLASIIRHMKQLAAQERENTGYNHTMSLR